MSFALVGCCCKVPCHVVWWTLGMLGPQASGSALHPKQRVKISGYSGPGPPVREIISLHGEEEAWHLLPLHCVVSLRTQKKKKKMRGFDG